MGGDDEFDAMMREIDAQIMEGTLRWSDATLLADIARSHYDLFVAGRDAAENLRSSPHHTPTDCPICDEIRGLQFDALKQGIVVVTFAAFALEAHINEYGSRRLGASYFERFLDKLDTVSKWTVIPRLVSGQEMSRDSTAFQLLVEVFRFRNKIGHPKARDVPVKDYADGEPFGIREHNLLFEFIPRAMQALTVLAAEAARLDPSDDRFGTLSSHS